MTGTALSAEIHDSEDTDAEGEEEELGAKPTAFDSGADPSMPEQASMTQHKDREGPLEGSADLTFTVPIIKVTKLSHAIMTTINFWQLQDLLIGLFKKQGKK